MKEKVIKFCKKLDQEYENQGYKIGWQETSIDYNLKYIQEWRLEKSQPFYLLLIIGESSSSWHASHEFKNIMSYINPIDLNFAQKAICWDATTENKEFEIDLSLPIRFLEAKRELWKELGEGHKIVYKLGKLHRKMIELLCHEAIWS